MPHNIAEQRAADWKAKGVPRLLWPDVGQDAIEKAHRAIWDVTAQILAGDLPTLNQPENAQRPLGIAATISGMGALLGFWRERGQIECDPATSQLLLSHLDHGRRRAYKLETALTEILDACQDRSIRPTVLKGTFTARRYFPEPGTRPQADIDLLVRPEDLASTHDALTQLEFRKFGDSAPGTETWMPTANPKRIQSVELEHADNPWSVDLHTTIDRPYFRGRWSHFGQIIFAATERWTIRQRLALVFGQPLLLAHLAHHTARDINKFRLVRLVELIFVMRHDQRLNWIRCLELLRKAQIIGHVYPAFALAERLAPGTVEPHFLESVTAETTPAIRRAVDQIAANPLRAFFKRRLSERLMWADGPVEKLMCWSDIVWPMGQSVRERLFIAKRRMSMARR